MDESNFYSLDKLVEFGMGMAIASQMANSMNASLNSMATPGVEGQMRGKDGYWASNPSPSIYYVVIDGRSAGPFSPSELSQLIADKKLTKESYVWKPGMKDWEIAENVSDVLAIVALTPPPLPQS